MDKQSLKKLLIKLCANASSIEMYKNNGVILTTAAGIIYGNIANVTEENAEEFDVGAVILSSFIDQAVEIYKQSGEGTYSESDGCILLTDAIIKDGNFTYNAGSLIVFYDQIIAVSIGNLN
jgi:hypothetical protein